MPIKVDFFKSPAEKEEFKYFFPFVFDYFIEKGLDKSSINSYQHAKELKAQLAEIRELDAATFKALTGNSSKNLVDEVNTALNTYRNGKSSWKMFSERDEFDRTLEIEQEIKYESRLNLLDDDFEKNLEIEKRLEILTRVDYIRNFDPQRKKEKNELSNAERMRIERRDIQNIRTKVECILNRVEAHYLELYKTGSSSQLVDSLEKILHKQGRTYIKKTNNIAIPVKLFGEGVQLIGSGLKKLGQGLALIIGFIPNLFGWNLITKRYISPFFELLGDKVREWGKSIIKKSGVCRITPVMQSTVRDIPLSKAVVTKPATIAVPVFNPALRQFLPTATRHVRDSLLPTIVETNKLLVRNCKPLNKDAKRTNVVKSSKKKVRFSLDHEKIHTVVYKDSEIEESHSFSYRCK